MGPYYSDESNLFKYEGHDLLNLRYQYDSGNNWYMSARVTNLLDTKYAERADVKCFFRFFRGSLFCRAGQESLLYCWQSILKIVASYKLQVTKKATGVVALSDASLRSLSDLQKTIEA